ncbi:uncharacterized protein [Triticum aestivum]|uniref:uncharacterized protein n=1 Tax=Triticum aestivum TaxID=4565 RepID=UPI001D003D01|nr:uncharacterized protein LOC123171168 [Triticum aestivum]
MRHKCALITTLPRTTLPSAETEICDGSRKKTSMASKTSKEIHHFGIQVQQQLCAIQVTMMTCLQKLPAVQVSVLPLVPTTGDGATVQAENVHTLIHNRDVDGHTGPQNTNNGNVVSASATDEIPAKDTTRASFPNSTPLPANAADTTGMQKEYPDEVADRRSTSPSPNTDSHENICAHPTNTSLTPYLISDDGPSNCQATGDDLPISATPKIEPDVEVARFLRIIADQPSYFNVYDSYQNMENTKDTDRERKWISLKTPLCLDMTGHAIYRSYGAGKIMKNNGMKVVVHVLTTKNNKLYPNRKPRWRSIIGPCFAEEFANNPENPNIDRFFSMFDATKLPYKLEETKKFMIVLVVDGGWCVYEVDINERTLHVMDPMMASSRRDDVERKHRENAGFMLHCLCKCLREWYPNWHFTTYPWTYKYNSGIHHRNSDRADSGFYVIHYIREFDGVMLHTAPTDDLIKHLRKEMAYEALRLNGNRGDFPNNLYARILE